MKVAKFVSPNWKAARFIATALSFPLLASPTRNWWRRAARRNTRLPCLPCRTCRWAALSTIAISTGKPSWL
jgi:hypothetical protein